MTMGLDMYLSKKTYVKGYTITINKNGETNPSLKTSNSMDLNIKQERITYIVEEVAYWRKFNALHKWFIDNCSENDCDSHIFVYKENLNEALITLKKVHNLILQSEKTKKIIFYAGDMVEIEGYSNEEEISDLLPTERGFFFGSTEIDEYYAEMVEETIGIFEDLLTEEDDAVFIYEASW